MAVGELDYKEEFCPVPSIEWNRSISTPVVRDILWPVDYSCCPHVDESTPQRVLNAAAAAASTSLWDLTCRKYTVCLQSYRPCVPCACSLPCASNCKYEKIDLFSLTAGKPVVEVDAVYVNGVLIDAGDYRLTYNRFLVPHEGGGLWSWPSQNLNLAAGQAGTWSVDVYVGQLPPPLLLLAANDMACQLVARCLNRPCDIPDNAVSVTREGVTIKLETGLSAIPTVKQALEVYGDCRKQHRSGLYDPAKSLVPYR